MTSDSQRLRGYVVPSASRRAWTLGLLPWLAGCSRDADGSVQRLQRRGSLAVGYALEEPYVQLAADGQPQGESPAAARAVARHLQLPRIDWVQTEFRRLTDELLARRFDLVAAGLFITPERQLKVRFSRPTLQVQPGWLTLRGNPSALGGYADAGRRPGLRLAVLAGSEEQRQLADGARAQLVEVPDVQSAQAAVRRGAVDGLALSLPSVRQLASQDPERLQAVPAPGTPTRRVALAMRPDEPALHAAVDRALGRYLGSAEHLRELQRLGLSVADLPASGTAP